MKSEQLLVLIGDAKNYFEGTTITGQEPTRLKFVILQQPSSMHKQLLLMKEGAQFKFHAEGVLEYMKNNELTKILIFGGGKVIISPKHEPMFVEKSYFFGIPYNEVIIEVVKNIWPDTEPTLHMGSATLVPHEGKIFTKEELEREAQHARNNM